LSRPKVLQGKTIKVETGCGNLYVTCNFIKGEIKEVFCRLGKAGGCGSCQTEALGRLISLALKNDVPVEKVIKNLKGISCHRPTKWGRYKIQSCADATGKAIEIALKDEIEEDNSVQRPLKETIEKTSESDCNKNNNHKSLLRESEQKDAVLSKGKVCPECGSSNLKFESGCFTCQDCNYSECG